MLQITSTLQISAVSRHHIPVAGAVAALALLALTVGACSRTTTVDKTNPCTTDDMFVELPARSAALEQATSIDAVTWTAGPKIKDSTLEATGTPAQGVKLFDPLREGNRDSPAFSVYYVGHTESLVELVPNLPEGQCWKTTVTIASTEIGTPEGAGDPGFTITASSPLFRDVVGSELELRVWGTDAGGTEVLLSKVSIATE